MNDYVAIQLFMDSIKLSLSADGTMVSFAGNGSTRFVHIRVTEADPDRLHKAVDAFNREMRAASFPSFQIVEG
jgi:hypothetical protein